MGTSIAAPERGQLRRAVVASAIGTAIEWYDFFLYGFAAALVFPKLFFPGSSPYTGMLLAFSTYFVGFVARPIGAAIFGHYGDRIGRKATLVATLVLMGVATFAVGLVPTYAAIGVWGGICLTLARVLQGIGVGGEWGGSVLLSLEWGHQGKRGFIASWPQFGVPVGLLTANGALALFSAISGDGFMTWGWRVPFLFSAVLVALGLYIRLGILETPVFAAILASRETYQAPFLEVWRKHWREVLLSTLIRTGQQAPFYIATVFVLTYGKDVLQFSRGTLLRDVMLSATLSLFTVPLFGYLSDVFGRKRVYLAGAVAQALFAYAYFSLLDTKVPLLVALAILLSVPVHDIMYAPQAAFIAEAFPARVRYSGASLGYQLASVTAGGPAPLIALALFKHFQNSFAIATYLALCAVISFVSAAVLRENSQGDLLEALTAPEGCLS